MKAIDEIDDRETRAKLYKQLDIVNGKPPEAIHEALSSNDVNLVKAIYVRLTEYIQGSVLLAFLEQRRQIKALQRELADHRKQTDRESKLNKQFRDDAMTKLGQIQTLLSLMQVPVEKDGGDYRTQRKQFYRKQKDAYELIDKIGRRLGVK